MVGNECMSDRMTYKVKELSSLRMPMVFVFLLKYWR